MARPSQAEQDRRRRERAPSKNTGKTTRNVVIGLAAAVVVALLVWVSGGDREDPVGDRAANLAAFEVADDPFLGNASADVVVVAFEAPRCSQCRAFHFTTLQDMDRDHFQTGQAVFYYVQYHISPEDRDIGIMQECALREAGNPGFWDFTDRIYGLHAYPSISAAEQAFQEWAGEAGAEGAWSCYQERETAGLVSADWRLGDDLGVPGTPTFYVFGPEGEPVRAHAGNVADVVAGLVA